LGFDNLVKKTFEIMQKETNFILFEGAFVYNGFKIRTDVIINKNGKFKLCEVKAITNCLEYHALDIMFQAKILQKNGYDIDN
jgi:hypothetical protein